MTVQCCKCKRIRQDGRWQPTSAATETPASHTYCPACLLEANVAIFNERASFSRVRHARDILKSLAVTLPA